MITNVIFSIVFYERHYFPTIPPQSTYSAFQRAHGLICLGADKCDEIFVIRSWGTGLNDGRCYQEEDIEHRALAKRCGCYCCSSESAKCDARCLRKKSCRLITVVVPYSHHNCTQALVTQCSGTAIIEVLIGMPVRLRSIDEYRRWFWY